MHVRHLIAVLSLLWVSSSACSNNDQGAARNESVAQTETKSAMRGRLDVSSVPSGAHISLDQNDTRLRTPASLTVEEGVHSITLKLDNYRDNFSSVRVKGGETIAYDVMIKPVCPGTIVGDLGRKPEIKLFGPDKQTGRIRGRANNIDARKVRVVLWAKTDIWYVQPFYDAPFTTICADGSWETWTHPWEMLKAELVDETFTLGSERGILAVDEYPHKNIDILHGPGLIPRTVTFGDQLWIVRRTGIRAGPGPNYFSDWDSLVYVDEHGLHLAIEQHEGNWFCSEVVAEKSLGYGEYSFQVSADLGKLDSRAVFAGFIYESDEREVDIEFSSALASPHNAQYIVQPHYRVDHRKRFTVGSFRESTHRLVWRPDHLEFSSWVGLAEEQNPENLLQSWSYTGPDIPTPGQERMHFNLWLAEGKSPAKRVEVVVRFFRYRP